MEQTNRIRVWSVNAYFIGWLYEAIRPLQRKQVFEAGAALNETYVIKMVVVHNKIP